MEWGKKKIHSNIARISKEDAFFVNERRRVDTFSPRFPFASASLGFACIPRDPLLSARGPYLDAPSRAFGQSAFEDHRGRRRGRVNARYSSCGLHSHIPGWNESLFGVRAPSRERFSVVACRYRLYPPPVLSSNMSREYASVHSFSF